MGVAQACHPTFTSAVRAASVFRKKSVAVCGFFGVFLCGFAVFGPPLRPRHKGLTVQIYIILVCTQQLWALQVTPAGFCS